MKANFLILTPVYKDWKNLEKLLSKINILFSKKKINFDLIVVDDNSRQKINKNKLKFSRIKSIRIIKLNENLGSQRAIAIGLKFIQKHYSKSYNTIIIDSDGQDNPIGILKMIKKMEKTNSPVVASRGQRKEERWFKFFYEVYCILIFFLTFKKIRFGNFSILKETDVNKILKDKNLWNAYPPTLAINLKKIQSITIDREKRLSGKSKVNFFGLIYHALRVFSVLKNRILVSSLLYMIFSYNFFFNNYYTLFILVLSFFVSLNLINFLLSSINKKKFVQEFQKIKVLKY